MNITDEMLDKGQHVLSEWLNDNAPIGERRYREPAKACFEAMLALTAAPASAEPVGWRVRKAGQATVDRVAEYIHDYTPNRSIDDLVDYLTRIVDACVSAADAAPASAEPVKVKPLEWHERLKSGDREGFICSEGGILSYSIMLSTYRVYGVIGEHDGAAEFDSLDAAKAAAQSDYEQRIRSAIDSN